MVRDSETRIRGRAKISALGEHEGGASSTFGITARAMAPGLLPKAPRAIRMLAQHGADALRPSLVNGLYHGPMVKPRAAAMVKKRAIIEGTVGSFCPQFGGWLTEWDVQKKVFLPRAGKGHLRERNREQRADKITRALGESDKKVPHAHHTYHAYHAYHAYRAHYVLVLLVARLYPFTPLSPLLPHFLPIYTTDQGVQGGRERPATRPRPSLPVPRHGGG